MIGLRTQFNEGLTMIEVNPLIKELSETMREAIKSGNVNMAERLENKINELIKYSTNIKS